jgi:hypothetical protein
MFISPASQFDAVTRAVVALTQPQIVAEAKRLHGEVMATDPRPLNFVRHVDGVEAPEEAVKPGGVIVYDYNRLDIIAKDALDLLRKESPVKSGDYVRSHTLFLNLTPVDNLKDWKPGDEISITNTVVYSRVIETGKRGSKVVRFSVPPHIYERVARALRSTYAGLADIQFTYRAVLGGGQIDQLTQGATALKRGARGRFVGRGGVRSHNKAEVRWPTITINPAGSFYSRSGLR